MIEQSKLRATKYSRKSHSRFLGSIIHRGRDIEDRYCSSCLAKIEKCFGVVCYRQLPIRLTDKFYRIAISHVLFKVLANEKTIEMRMLR